jgi:uncharacterized protein (DUF427 family)
MSVNPPPEDVWAYPRPPRLEAVRWPVRIEHRGVLVVDAATAHRVLETSHPPVYYVAPEQVVGGLLRPSDARPSFCEWKGRAEYFDLVVDGAVVRAAAWSYADPVAAFAPIRGAFAFYASKVDACSVAGERVIPQAGDFYGGWITSWIGGGERGFKGGPGTGGW